MDKIRITKKWVGKKVKLRNGQMGFISEVKKGGFGVSMLVVGDFCCDDYRKNGKAWEEEEYKSQKALWGEETGFGEDIIGLWDGETL